ncbi:hypothetical protein P4H70_16280 [Paenibacillus ehimensis]|uniref:hypothetical protein n=1 Tax=Paenibacillus ehimensis TaxID=79264 RepID=UPI002DB96BDF|nr:hypothetical protein [Paenibacillus ehimensis]MEC0210498.1 hypothetical protein [Paenibacillus ehimensis]
MITPVVDDLHTRPEVDKQRIALMGISLGGLGLRGPQPMSTALPLVSRTTACSPSNPAKWPPRE